MFKGFAKSIAMGTLAAALMPIVFIAILTIGYPMTASDLKTAAAILSYVVGIAFVVVLSSALTFGLLTTYFLKIRGWESLATYAGIGAGAGVIVPLIVGYFIGGQLGYFSLLGFFSGALTGRTWWLSYRRQVADDC